ncbi:MAG: hypothetical protein PSX36_04950 [bacterium]|nr:hypothetical protein [bacterium]
MSVKKKENIALVITANKKLSLIQKEFNLLFPFLKLEFFRTKHGVKASSPKKDILKQDFTLKEFRKKNLHGSITITEEMVVSTLEQLFDEQFGISAQVFRKSGRSWLETSMTDDWTLKRQNDQGRELSYFA